CALPIWRRIPCAIVYEGCGTVDGVDGAGVAALGVVTPCHEAMLREQDELRVRILADRLADLLRERESGPDVRDPDRIVAVALLREPFAVLRATDHVYGIRVRVIDAGGGNEGMEQGLDGAARHVRGDLAPRE